MSIPVLETPRLRLRGITVEDLDRYCALWQDENVIRYTSGTALSREAVWARVLRVTGHWQLLGFGFFAIEHRASGELIGEAGFHDLHRDIEPSLEGTLESGWMLRPEFHGQGIAREVMDAAIAWAEARFPEMDFSAIIDADNAPSRKLAERLGFTEDCPATYNAQPTLIYRRRGIRQAARHSGPSYQLQN